MKYDNKTIMIVDDEEDVRTYLQTLFDDHMYNTIVADDGDKAYNLLKDGAKPDLITLDLQMPNETGTHFYRKLKKKDEFSGIPVIVISGLAGKHLAAAAEAVAVLDKPVDADALMELIKKTIG